MLTRAELEYRLLDFVRTRLVTPDLAAGVIDSHTRLFEQRIVDSLKVLELIAFLESTTGRKIPDAQVVLANFRSIETMASAFSTNGHEAAAPPRRPRGSRNGRNTRRQPRIFENATGRHRYVDAAATLTERGEVVWDAEGGLELRGSALALTHYLDSTVTTWARELGAVEQLFAETIDIQALKRAGFIDAFPQKLVTLDGENDYVLPPAVCYHHYPQLAGRIVSEPGSVITAVGRCFRNECDEHHPLERLRAFTMREIIAVGPESFVKATRENLIERVRSWMTELGLDGFIETAADPFFTRETRGRLLMQQLQPLKYELRLQVSADARTVAAASFNYHQDFFARSFSISQENGEPAHSGCVAFGWERWILAFVAHHGANEANWPDITRSVHAVAS
jgi:acyl carrier protein